MTDKQQKPYYAKRDSAGYIYIHDAKNDYPIGHAGYDYALILDDIPGLAKKLGIDPEDVEVRCRNTDKAVRKAAISASLSKWGLSERKNKG
jgi:hypothetical protein